MLASASGELYTRSRPKRFCSPQVTPNTPPLPLHLGEQLLVRGVRHVLAEQQDARVARHLVAQAVVDALQQRLAPLGLRRRRRDREALGGRVHVGRVDVRASRSPGRAAALARAASARRGDLRPAPRRAGARAPPASRMPSLYEEAREACAGSRARPRPRAPPATCTCSRRPTSSASRAASPGRARSAGPAPLAAVADRLARARRATRPGRCRPRRRPSTGWGSRAPAGPRRRPPSARPPAPRWRSRCPRSGTAPGACRLQAAVERLPELALAGGPLARADVDDLVALGAARAAPGARPRAPGT